MFVYINNMTTFQAFITLLALLDPAWIIYMTTATKGYYWQLVDHFKVVS